MENTVVKTNEPTKVVTRKPVTVEAIKLDDKYSQGKKFNVTILQEVDTIITYESQSGNNNLGIGNIQTFKSTSKRRIWLNIPKLKPNGEEFTEDEIKKLIESSKGNIIYIDTNWLDLTPQDKSIIDNPKSDLTARDLAIKRIIPEVDSERNVVTDELGNAVAHKYNENNVEYNMYRRSLFDSTGKLTDSKTVDLSKSEMFEAYLTQFESAEHVL